MTSSSGWEGVWWRGAERQNLFAYSHEPIAAATRSWSGIHAAVDKIETSLNEMDSAWLQPPIVPLVVARDFLKTMRLSADMFIRGEQRIRVMQIILASHRYRLRTGKLPETLDDLVPEYLDTVPTDVVTDQPLKYRVEADSWLVYGVREDGRDRGGHFEEDLTSESFDQPDIGFRIRLSRDK